MRYRLTALVLILAMSAFMMAPARAVAAQHVGAVTVPVTGTNSSGSFVGTATITRFVAQNGQVFAVGTLAGTLTNTATGAVSSILTTFSTLVTISQASCSILDLIIGPIHLNLLGLVIDTNQIVLNITAQPGPGNLLGNLLCAVANALNPSGLATALNNLLAALGL